MGVLRSARGVANGYRLYSRVALTGEEPFKEQGRDMALLKVGIIENAFVQRDGRLDAFDHKFVEGSAHAGNGLLPVPAMGDDLGDHRIVERDDHHVRLHRRVDSHAESTWRAIFGDEAGAGCKFVRVFGVDTAFEAVPVELDVLLFE